MHSSSAHAVAALLLCAQRFRAEPLALGCACVAEKMSSSILTRRYACLPRALLQGITAKSGPSATAENCFQVAARTFASLREARFLHAISRFRLIFFSGTEPGCQKCFSPFCFCVWFVRRLVLQNVPGTSPFQSQNDSPETCPR